jgi:hypothetical protein
MFRMSFSERFANLLNSRRARRGSAQRRRTRQRVRPWAVQQLEDRSVLSVTLSTPTLDFGSDPVGVLNPSPRTTTLLNQDPNNILLSVTAGGANPGDFQILTSPSVGQPLGVGGQPFRFGFDPSLVGGESATYLIATSDGSETVTLTGTGTSPVVLTSPNLDFGSVTIGTPTPSIRSTAILNQDPNNVLLSATLGGPNAADFTLVSGPAVGQPLPTAPSSFRFSFTPTAVGSESASYTLNTSDGPLTVDLTGTGTSELALTSPSLDFGSVTVGTIGPSIRTTAILNQDPNNVLLSVTADGPNAADFTLASGQFVGQPLPTFSLPFRFSFTPSVVGPESATYTLNTSDGPLTVHLAGIGTSGFALASPNLDFGSVTVGTASPSIRATAILNPDPNNVLLSVTPSGPNASDFTLVSSPAIGQPLTTDPLSFRFSFTPTAVGTESATYSIATSDGSETVTLTGTGASPAVLASPNLDFGSVAVGTTGPSIRSTAILNQDPNNVLLSATADGPNAADFTLVSGPAVGQPLTTTPPPLRFSFNPTVIGPESATYTLNTSDGPLTVTLTGIGSSSPKAPISLNHSSISFGNVQAGTTSAPLAVGLWNFDPNNQLLGVTSDSPLAADFPLLNLSTLSVNQPIPVASSPTSASLQFQFGFNPSTTGAESATYTIQTSDGNLTVTLSGTGATGGSTSPISLASPNLDFGPVTIDTTGPSLRTTAILNQDPNNVLLSVTPGGANAADFTLVSGPAVGQPLTATPPSFRFSFTPTAIGAESATYTLNTSDGPLTIHLAGAGTNDLALTSPNLDFGSVTVGTLGPSIRTTAVLNQDPNNILLSVTPSGPNVADFTLASGPIVGQPLPTVSLSFRFTFTPTIVGAESATYTLITSDGPLTIDLTGVGTSEFALVSPNLDFGSVTVGTASPSIRATAILNQDPNNLVLSVTPGGPNAADFSLVSGPAVGQPLTTNPTKSPVLVHPDNRRA